MRMRRVHRRGVVCSVLPALLACVDGVRDDGTAGVGGAIAGAGGAGGAIAGSGGAGGAGASMTAVATIAPFGTGTVTGTVTFTQSGTDVTVVVSLQNCPDGMHGVHVHQGTSCLDANTQGGHWDMTRGEGIPDVICSGGAGTAMHTRVAADPTLAWSIGGAPATNLVGHVFVVHDPGDLAPRIGCGAIAAQ